MVETQIRERMKERGNLEHYDHLVFNTYGTVPEDAPNQAAATVDFRVFAQAKKEEHVSHKNFFRPCIDVLNITYPAAQFALDARQSEPKVYYEYWVSLEELKTIAASMLERIANK